ncbi:MAG: formylglycine-generating enzyme family protein [Deltaproteobacteria bacterium]|nr:MAG: formylglycine-generating enzyme family protein [Deltaproteobacteria bacterium]
MSMVLLIPCVFLLSLVFQMDLGFSASPGTVTNSVGMKFVLVPAGTFTMGSPPDEPQREPDERQYNVTIGNPFYLQTTEVTQAQWKKVMGSNPSHFKHCGGECPVEMVSWHDAREFLKKLNQIEQTDKYRLPTEAEWEYACRAGTSTPFITGNCISTVQANYNGEKPIRNCPKGAYREKTMRVASFPPNPWGLYDMHGNVWEWCQDWYSRKYPEGHVIDPKGPSRGALAMLRGGSWFGGARLVRSAYRRWDIPDYRSHVIGFRVVKDFGMHQSAANVPKKNLEFRKVENR